MQQKRHKNEKKLSIISDLKDSISAEWEWTDSIYCEKLNSCFINIFFWGGGDPLYLSIFIYKPRRQTTELKKHLQNLLCSLNYTETKGYVCLFGYFEVQTGRHAKHMTVPWANDKIQTAPAMHTIILFPNTDYNNTPTAQHNGDCLFRVFYSIN